jgi:hypothetical protein
MCIFYYVTQSVLHFLYYFIVDELDLPITVDDYKNRLAELQEELFAKAALLPGLSYHY